jgi:DNA repair protein RadC
MMVQETLFGEQGMVLKTAEEMSNAELLSAVLGVAENNLQYGSLSDIMHAPTNFKGIGEKKQEKLFAVRELARRLMTVSPKIEIIHGPEDVAHFAMPKFRFEDKEHFAIMVLNTKNHIIAIFNVRTVSANHSIKSNIPYIIIDLCLRPACADIYPMSVFSCLSDSRNC